MVYIYILSHIYINSYRHDYLFDNGHPFLGSIYIYTHIRDRKKKSNNHRISGTKISIIYGFGFELWFSDLVSSSVCAAHPPTIVHVLRLRQWFGLG